MSDHAFCFDRPIPNSVIIVENCEVCGQKATNEIYISNTDGTINRSTRRPMCGEHVVKEVMKLARQK